MELTEGEMEGKDLRIIEHPSHDHPLVLRESLQGAGNYGGGHVQVYCDGCREPISSSSSGSVWGGGGYFYACPNSDCWFLLHKRCAELPLKIEHPSHPEHALTLSPVPLYSRWCHVCESGIDGFLYHCSDCLFDVHVRCASMALRIQDRVDENNKIHLHPLIPLEKEAQFLCDACGREHKGKSYLCPTCGFWVIQICASAPTTISLRSHPHPLSLLRHPHPHAISRSCFVDFYNCQICKEVLNRAYWVYRCSKRCNYFVHVGCLALEGAENSNKDIQTNSESPSHKIEIPTDSKEENIPNTWPVQGGSAELITWMIKNLNLQETHKRATKIFHCKNDHPLIFANKKMDESKDDQLCDGCVQPISSQFYNCAQCNFSLHEWCAKLPNVLQHIFHKEHPITLNTLQDMYCPHIYCDGCAMPTNGFVFSCSTCNFHIDLKCALLPRVINHRAHDHSLALRRATITDSCNACGVDSFRFSTCFRCEACNFWLCIRCALLPLSVRHRYDKHPFALNYSPIKGKPDEYYCEICEKDINSMYWFYHCIKCDQSLHLKCINSIERSMIVQFGVRVRVSLHSHLLICVPRPKAGVLSPCHYCGCNFREAEDCMAYDCEQCDFWMHALCVYLFFLNGSVYLFS